MLDAGQAHCFGLLSEEAVVALALSDISEIEGHGFVFIEYVMESLLFKVESVSPASLEFSKGGFRGARAHALG